MAEEKKKTTRSAKGAAGSRLASALKSENAAKRKEALEEAIKRKVELDKRALQMVESLLEEDVTEEYFLDCAKFITPSHYKDTIDERFIIRLCGYPLCRNKLKNVPKQKYKISTKNNKVYDITERKCFCSDFCYRASKYFEAQIPKNPVWLRDDERAPNFQLLKEGQSGRSGLEVKLLDTPINSDSIENPDLAASQSDPSSSDSDSDGIAAPDQEFVSAVVSRKQAGTTKLEQQFSGITIKHKRPAQKVNTGANDIEKKVLKAAEQLEKCSLEEQDQGNSEQVWKSNVERANQSNCEQMSKCNVEEQKNNNSKQVSNSILDEQAKIHRSSSEQGPTSVATVDQSPRQSVIKNTPDDNCLGSEVTSQGVSKRGAEQLRRLLDKSKQHLKPALPLLVDPVAAKQTMLAMLLQTLMEWKTDETLTFLYGTNCTTPEPPIVIESETEELDEDDLDLDAANLAHSEELSHNVCQISLDESLPFKNSETAVKQLPSYEKLKEETALLDLRVREYLKGKYILPEEVDHPKGEKVDLLPENEAVREGDPYLPLVDSLSQHDIRKRIVLEKLKKVLPAILVPLDITYGDICIELHNLVKTFRLTNKNIIHRTPEWSLIAVVLLSLLSPMIPIQKNARESPIYTQFISTLLGDLHMEEEDLESLINVFKNKTLPK
ncbi:putative RNA polymerase II subunit B1 CTD phosphatase RPAP2 isoform X1 [Pleurodeles waltl]|uniref:putative RNA polymerase II subunit B1 CTD phosphatase RPAP2 isoform X1 n=2 Tax=Pleurodeles waltl TaxID=8319 RepID=UPI0037098FF4